MMLFKIVKERAEIEIVVPEDWEGMTAEEKQAYANNWDDKVTLLRIKLI